MKHAGADIRKEYDGRKLIAYAEKHGAVGRWAKGDHRLEQYKNSVTVIPARVIGHGLQCKIVRWMEAVGIIAAVVGALAWAF